VNTRSAIYLALSFLVGCSGGVDDGSEATDASTCEPEEGDPTLAGCTVTETFKTAEGDVLDYNIYVYDDAGRWLSTERYDVSSEGEELTYSERYERDELGRLTSGELEDFGTGSHFTWSGRYDGCDRSESQWDMTQDGSVDQIERYTYDSYGSMSEAIGTTENGYVTDDGLTTWRVTFDNTETTSLRRYDADDDGSIESSIWTEFPSDDRLTLKEVDWDEDGELDQRVTWVQGEYGYTARSEMYLTDHGMNGTSEDRFDTVTYLDGLMAHKFVDHGADNTIDLDYHYKYDDDGRIDKLLIDENPNVYPGTDYKMVYTYACASGTTQSSRSGVQPTPNARPHTEPERASRPASRASAM